MLTKGYDMKVKVKKYLEDRENNKKLDKVDIRNVYLADINIATSLPAIDHHGPIMVSQYIFAKEKDGEYYELFSEMPLNTKKANITMNSPIVTILEDISLLIQPSTNATEISKEELQEYLLIRNAERHARNLRETHFSATNPNTTYEFC